VTTIALSPTARIYCHAAAHEHRSAAMTSYMEASCQVAKDSHYVIDLSQDTTIPFAAVINGCTCAGCTYLKAGVIYKMKCYINTPSLAMNIVAQACVPSVMPGLYSLVNTSNAPCMGNIPATCA
jgi:hypothetical protein